MIIGETARVTEQVQIVLLDFTAVYGVLVAFNGHSRSPEVVVFSSGIGDRAVPPKDVKGVLDEMLGLLPTRVTAGPQLEVLNTIVGTDAVLVMDGLVRLERAPEVARHHEDVLEDAPTLSSVGMAAIRDNPVAIVIQAASATGCVAPERPQFLAAPRLSPVTLAEPASNRSASTAGERAREVLPRAADPQRAQRLATQPQMVVSRRTDRVR